MRLPGGSRSDPGGFDTEYSAATVSQTKAVSFKVTLHAQGGVHVLNQTGLASARASSSEEEGPMPPCLQCFVFFQGSREPLPPSPSPRPAPAGAATWGRARAKARRGGPLLSSPSRGLVLRRLLRQFLLGWASNHVALLVLYHVPDDRRQPAHHRHPGNLRAAAALDPAVPGSTSRICTS